MVYPRNFIYAGPDYSTRDHHVPAPYFRRRFEAKTGTQAKLVICGLGFYELFVNGERATKGRMAPYISAPADIAYYDAYEIGPLLRDGENVLGVLLGNGFQNDPAGYVWDFQLASWRGAPRLALSLTLTGPDGTEEVIEADETFRTAPSPILFDAYRYGEIYDARKEIPGWNLPGFDDSAWQTAVPCDGPTGEKRLCGCEPIAVTGTVEPVEITKEENGWRYDFGLNQSGVCMLQIDGEAGQEISLYHGEWVHDGRLDLSNITFEHRFGPDELLHRDRYICKGEGTETYTPTFTYHGFRYVLVTGISEAQATKSLLTYQVMHSDLAERGNFHCSDEMANALQAATRRSDLSNFFYFPNDCPHREKNGWTADAALSAEHMLLNLSPERSYIEWLRNIRKAQDDRGALPGIVPTGGWGFDWGNGPAWDNVLFLLPYYTYLYRGDDTILRENAGAMLRYLQYIGTRFDADGLLAIGLGDWCPVGRDSSAYKAPLRFTDSTLVYDMAEKAAYMFAQIGCMREAEYAAAIARDMRSAIRARLLDLRTMTAIGNCQTSQAMGLYYGLFEPGEQPAAFDRLLAMIDETGGHIDVGVLGGRVLFDVLTAFGRSDLAYEMITRPDYPSYGNWIARGATTLWENFFPEGEDPKSMNHHFWGDISGWFLRALCGIRVNPHRAGAVEIDIRPSFVPQLSEADGYHLAPAGKVVVDWHREGDTILLALTYPETAHGQIILESGWTFEDGTAVRKAESGTYPIVPSISR